AVVGEINQILAAGAMHAGPTGSEGDPLGDELQGEVGGVRVQAAQRALAPAHAVDAILEESGVVDGVGMGGGREVRHRHHQKGERSTGTQFHSKPPAGYGSCAARLRPKLSPENIYSHIHNRLDMISGMCTGVRIPGSQPKSPFKGTGTPLGRAASFSGGVNAPLAHSPLRNFAAFSRRLGPRCQRRDPRVWRGPEVVVS